MPFRKLFPLLLILLVLPACAQTSAPPPPLHALLISPDTLNDLTTAYADRYVLLVAAATDTIQEQSTDVHARHLAQKLKSESATSVYDIVTAGDSYGRLLDLTVAVTLQSEVYIDEDRAEALFGKQNALPLIRALRQARLEIWNIAARSLTQEQLDNLDLLIVDFRRHNPTLTNVITVRFNDFANSQSKALIADSSSGGIFSQIDQARQEVDQARQLAERAFFYSKRAPLLLSWQVETHADEMLDKPELMQFLADIHRFANLADNLPAILDGQRKAVLTAFDERQGSLKDLMASTKDLLAQADKVINSGTGTLQELQRTTGAVDNLLHSADTIAGKYMPPPGTTLPASTEPVHPFDVREYTAAMVQATATLKEVEQLLKSSDDMMGSPSLTNRIVDIQKTADDRMRLAEAQSETLVSTIFFRIYLAIAFLFIAGVAYRLISINLTKKAAQK